MRKLLAVLITASLMLTQPASADNKTSWTSSQSKMSVLPWIEDTNQIISSELNLYPRSGNFPDQICLRVNGTDKFTTQSGLELPREVSWLSQIVEVFTEDIVLTAAQSRAYYLDNDYRQGGYGDLNSCRSVALGESRDRLIGGNNDGNSKNDFAGGINFSFNLETSRLKSGKYLLQFSFLPDDGTVIPPLELNVSVESGYTLHDPWTDWESFPKLKSAGPTKTISVGSGKAKSSVRLKLSQKKPGESCGTLAFEYSLGDKKALKDYFLNIEIYHPNKSIAGRLPIYSDEEFRGWWAAGVMLCPYTWYEEVLQTGTLNEYEKATAGTYTGILELSHPSKKNWKTRFSLKLTN